MIDRIEEQLFHQPKVPTRNRKRLESVKSPWVFTGAAWELRVGEFRVFYDVDVKAKLVMIRGIRNKPPHRTSEDIV